MNYKHNQGQTENPQIRTLILTDGHTKNISILEKYRHVYTIMAVNSSYWDVGPSFRRLNALKFPNAAPRVSLVSFYNKVQ